jgi:MtN3 and saliva related transmembrane protein
MGFERLVDFVFGFGLIFNASLFIPQIVKIYRTKNASGLSLTTFAGFNLVQSVGILRGYLRDDWALVLGFGVSFALCGAVTVGICLYGGFFDRFLKKRRGNETKRNSHVFSDVPHFFGYPRLSSLQRHFPLFLSLREGFSSCRLFSSS